MNQMLELSMAVEINNKFSLKKLDDMQIKLAPICESTEGALSDKPPC
jgi:hypothetical protein